MSSETTYRYGRVAGGSLGRWRLLSGTQVPLCGELWIPGLDGWRLHAAIMGTGELGDRRFVEVPREAAVELAGGEMPLGLPCPDPADLTRHPSTDRDPRLAWVEDGIAATLEWARAEEGRVEDELQWARPGTDDYDAEIDHIGWIQHAYRTLEALIEEKRGRTWRRDGGS